MCANCQPGGGVSGLTGLIMALVICALFFVVAVGAMYMASRSGSLDDLEDTKYRMLED